MDKKSHRLTGSQAFLSLFLDSFQWAWLRWLIGIVLLAAAYLKWNGLGSGRGSMLAEIAPQLEWLLIQAELVLAIWLFLGWGPHFSWLVSLLMFSSFAGASLVMVVQGRSSCGCLGAVEFNPIWIMLFDLAVIGSLLLAGRRIADVSGDVEFAAGKASISVPSTPTPAFASRSVVLVIFGGLLGALAVSQSAAIGSAIAQYVPTQISGQYLVTSPAICNVGSGHPGELRSLTLTIHNRSDLPVTLIGAEQGCRCHASGSLPIDIPPGDQAEIDVRVRLGQTAGVQHDRFWLLTSHQRQGLLICRWRANVVEHLENEFVEPLAAANIRHRDSNIDRAPTPVSGPNQIPASFDSRSVIDREHISVVPTNVGDRTVRSRLLVGNFVSYQGIQGVF